MQEYVRTMLDLQISSHVIFRHPGEAWILSSRYIGTLPEVGRDQEVK